MASYYRIPFANSVIYRTDAGAERTDPDTPTTTYVLSEVRRADRNHNLEHGLALIIGTAQNTT